MAEPTQIDGDTPISLEDKEAQELGEIELMDTEFSDFQTYEDSNEDSTNLSNNPKELEPFSNFSSISKSQELAEELSTEHFSVNTAIPQYYKPHNEPSAASSPSKPDLDSDQDIPTDEDELLSEGNSTRGSILSSQGLSPTPSIPGTPDRSSHIRSIDQRFQTRFNSLTSIRSNFSPPPGRPSTSLVIPSPNFDQLFNDSETDSPWETIRWSKLRKISSQIFSESASSIYGKPTCLLAAALIAIGTSRGYVLVFDYHQSLKSIIGQNTKAMECGEVTSLAVSADFSYLASGYSSGHIYTWDLAKPSSFNIHIRPISLNFVGKPRFDGHLENTSVIHLSFVGKRHSALISGDVKGMSFFHNTIRTIVGRSVKTKRIMGRYPQPHLTMEVTHKPTALLACSPLPLGTVVQPTDDMCLVAIMTPYLLAIVSVLPSPQTEFKTGRPKSVSNELGLSGCLAWFPALKSAGSSSETNPRLAYSWSNVLTIMEVSAIKKHESSTSRKDISLNFTSLKRFVGDEAIVSIQWISRQIITLVTVTQQLLILNEDTMTVAATIDLLSKHIMHHDYFSPSLNGLTFLDQTTNEVNPVVVADAYFNSIKSLKGKLFLMGNYEFVVGSISNWADRLLDTMEMGDYVGAIELATGYYLGTQDLVIVGLPNDDEERKSIVIKNLPGMIIASIKYTFNGSCPIEQPQKDQWLDLLTHLSQTCIRAWVAIDQPDELMEDIFESFETAGFVLLFFEELSHFISSGQVSYLPPRIFRELVKNYIISPELQDRLEELICSLDIQSLDLDLAISLCNEYHLKDTLIYIWNHALADFITPLSELFEIVKEGPRTLQDQSDAAKIYPYISYILTGRIYPTGLPFSTPDEATKARSYVYYLLFSSTNIAWPQGGPVIKTRPNGEEEPAYPYLLLLINYGCSEFFSALNEAFEDSFLNDMDSHSKSPVKANEALIFGNTINRQLIINILLELFHNVPELSDKKIFLGIFIARNYPKYSQFIMLPGNVLSKILEEVCLCQDPELKEECQLGVEALLSKYKPYDLDNIIVLLHEVKYYHVLQYIFRSEKRYAKLLETTFKMWKEDPIENLPDDNKLLDNIAECFRNTKEATGLQEKERAAIESIVVENFEYLLNINCHRIVRIISKYSPHLHENVFKLESRSDLQFKYFESLFGLAMSKTGTFPVPTMRYRHLYIKLLAQRGLNSNIHNLLKELITGAYDVDLNVLRKDLQEAGAVDSIILILLRQKSYSEAIDCVVERLYTLDQSIVHDLHSFMATDIRFEITRYLNIGVDICSSPEVKNMLLTKSTGNNLKSLNEQLWVTLIDALVDISKQNADGEEKEDDAIQLAKEQENFTRNLLLKTLSALLDNAGNGTQHNATIVRICSSLMTPLASSKPRTIGTVRPILGDLFSAYRYQQNVLSVAKQLLDKDAYDSLQILMAKRLEGWRVSKSGECEGCGKRILGLGVDADWLYEEWGNLQKLRMAKSKKQAAIQPAVIGVATLKQQRALLKGKGKKKSQDAITLVTNSTTNEDYASFELIAKGQQPKEKSSLLVIFKCQHTFHLGCLRNLGVKADLKCIICE